MSDGSPKRIAMDEPPNHQGVHVFRLGKAERPAYQPLDPGPHIDVLAVDLLRMGFATRVRLCLPMPFVGPPAVGAIARDAKWLQQRFERQQDGVLPASKHRGSHLARMVINGMPYPTWIRVAAHVAPHLVELGAEPTTHLQRIRMPSLHLDLPGMAVRPHALMHCWHVRRLFLNSLITVVGLMCNTRAGSRRPLAFMALSTICCVTSGD